MVKAYVLAKIQMGREADIRKALTKDECVKRLSFVYGQYDLVIEVEVAEMEDLDKFVFDRLPRLPGVHDTMTLIAAYGT